MACMFLQTTIERAAELKASSPQPVEVALREISSALKGGTEIDAQSWVSAAFLLARTERIEQSAKSLTIDISPVI